MYDGTGTYAGPSCAEFVATVADPTGEVELVTPDRRVCEEMGALNWPVFLRNLYRAGNVTITPDTSLRSVAEGDEKAHGGATRDGGVRAILGNDYFSDETFERRVDTVVVEHGTLPNDELFMDLRSISRNRGLAQFESSPGSLEDISSRSGDRDQLSTEPVSSFELYRVGDAVSSRNIHAAVYDAMRVCKEFI